MIWSYEIECKMQIAPSVASNTAAEHFQYTSNGRKVTELPKDAFECLEIGPRQVVSMDPLNFH